MRIYFSSTTVTNVTLTASAWSSSAPYTQTVTVAGVTAESSPVQGIVYPDNCTDAQRKTIQKNAAFITEIETGNGQITFIATQKPTVDLTLGLKGV